MDCSSLFSQIVAALYHIIWHTRLALEEFTAPKWRVSKRQRRLLQTDVEFSSIIIKQQGPIKQQF